MPDYISFSGVVTEIITPFTEDGAVDYTLLENEVEFQIQSKIHGLFTNGLASESLSLTPEEMVATTAATVEKAAGRVPVMGNIACNTLPTALQVLRGYENAGVDAISIEPPCVYNCSQQSLFDFFDELTKATPLPVGIYNAPQSGNTLAPETVAKLFHENTNMRYYKESTIDFVHIQNTMRLIGEQVDMEFLNGSDATTFAVMQLGGKGVVSLISTVFPEPVLALVEAMNQGDIKKAQECQNYVLQIRDALKTGPFVSGYKYAASLVGVPLGYMRKPLGELDEAGKAKIKTNLQQLNLITV